MVQDRRIRKTKEAIQNNFLELLKEKDLEKITIQDIANKADINRGTFYLHYEDKYYLLSEIEDEYVQSLARNVDLNEIIDNSVDIETFAERFFENILKKIVAYIYKNIEFYKVIFTLNCTNQLEEKLAALMYQNMEKQLAPSRTVSNIPLAYFHSYTYGAMISIIKYWVLDEDRMPPDELVNHIFKIIFNGPLRLMANEQVQ